MFRSTREFKRSLDFLYVESRYVRNKFSPGKDLREALQEGELLRILELVALHLGSTIRARIVVLEYIYY